MSDFEYHVHVYGSPPAGWDPDTPYTEVRREGTFRVEKSLTTSDFIITEPSGIRHIVQEVEPALRKLMGAWIEGDPTEAP